MYQQSHPQDHVLRDAMMVWPEDGSAYTAAWFETVFTALDRLHDALCSSAPDTVSRLNPEDMAGWLEDIVYTAQEAILEIRARYPGKNVTGAGC